MVVKAKTVFGSPFYFRDILELGGGPVEVDAAPFHTAIRIKRSGSGTKSRATASESIVDHISYSFEETFPRVATHGNGMVQGQLGAGGSGVGDGSWGYAALVPPPMGRCHLRVRINGDGGYLSVQMVITPTDDTRKVIGSEVITDFTTSPPEIQTFDVMGSGFWNVPIFWVHPFNSSSERHRDNRWGFGYPDGGIDISGWSLAKWRDLRGTYSQTIHEPLGLWDSNTVTHTYEWEIL